YKGKERHCGKCGTCYERKEAFALAGIADPTEYDPE
ncbi:MAG: 7-cyano-7-deazaguanine synthase, partial [Bacteroidota bacterium]